MEGEKAKETQYAMVEIGGRIRDGKVDTVVIISPHAPLFQDAVAINAKPKLTGDLGQFGAGFIKFELENDLPLVAEIRKQAEDLGFNILEMDDLVARRYGLDLSLDHGAMVPLFFMEEIGAIKPLVLVSMTVDSPEQLYLFGLAVRQASEVLDRRIAIVASGDLSHYLSNDGPYGYRERGEEFDREMVRLMGEADFEGIVTMDQDLVKEAGECGYRSIVMMLGALDGYDVKSEVLSYEGPFGVGYMVAIIDPLAPNPERALVDKLQKKKVAKLQSRRARESFPVSLARRTLESRLTGAEQPKLDSIPEEFKKRAGVFVSIKKHGNLRGCIGTIEPYQENIAAEIMANALSAGLQDPRFPPVRKEELDDLEYSVDVLKPPEPVSSIEELDPVKYGVIVSAGSRRGLLLPNLEGITTAEEQVAIARQKAGIGPEEEVKLERFEVIRYE